MTSALPLLHWFRRGGGTPTVLLHGFTGSAASWAALADGLSGAVAALHLPGHHPEAPLPRDYEDGVDWIARILAGHGVERARIVGYSLGARAALGLAVRHSGVVSSLTLIGVRPGLAEPAREARRRADAAWIERLNRDGVAAFVAAWEGLDLWASQRDLEERQLERQRAIRLGHTAAGLAGSLRTMGLAEMPDYSDELGRLPMPVQLVVGALDARFLELARALLVRHPSLSLDVVDGAGHNVPLEAPRRLAELLSR